MNTPNEDRSLVDKKNGIYAVFDGVGRNKGGELAAEIALKYIATAAREPRELSSLDEVSDFLHASLIGANQAILEQDRKAATTAVVAHITNCENQSYASVAHVGDSRAYLMRNGVLTMLTLDHNPVRTELVEVNGRATEQLKDRQAAFDQQTRLSNHTAYKDLSDDDYQTVRLQHLIHSALGENTKVEADITHIKVYPGDSILLTTDGIHDNLTSSEIGLCMQQPPELDRALLLATSARKRASEETDRSKPDDMTAVVINI